MGTDNQARIAQSAINLQEQGLQQSNQPKSDLSQQFSGALQNSMTGVLSRLLNTNLIGNAFLNRQGSAPIGGNYSQIGTGTPFTSLPQYQGPGSTTNSQSSSVSPAAPQGTGFGPNSTFVPNGTSYDFADRNQTEADLEQQYGPLSNRIAIAGMTPDQRTAALNAITQKYAGQYAYTDAQGNPTNYRPGYQVTNPDGSTSIQYGQQYANGNSMSGWYDPTTGALAPSGSYSTSSDLADLVQGQDKYDYSYLNQFANANPSMASILSSPQFVYGSPLTNTSGNALFSDVPSGYNVFTGQPSPQGSTNAPFLSIQNGQYVDQNGNYLGPAPSSNGAPAGGTGAGDLSIPGIAQAGTQGLNLSGLDPRAVNTLTSNFSGTPATADLSQVPNSLALNPTNQSYYDAVSQILNNQFTKDRADTAESFTGTGTSRGTGASYAQAQLRGQEIPQMTAALGNVRQQEVGNQLNSANLTQQGLLSNAQMLNQYGLAGNTLNSQNAGTLLNAQNANQLGLNNILSSLSQFNTGQTNTQNLALGTLNQQAAQAQIQNQVQALSQILGLTGNFGLAGIPGSPNISVGNPGQTSGSNIGGTLQGIGSILTAMAAFS